MAGKSRTFAGTAGMSHPRVSIRTMADRADGYFAQQLGLITLEQTVECGISSRTRERRCASGDWDRPHPRVYRSRAYTVSHEQRLLAATLSAGPHAAVSHHAAASFLHV